jgi:hypothetical protein
MSITVSATEAAMESTTSMIFLGSRDLSVCSMSDNTNIPQTTVMIASA